MTTLTQPDLKRCEALKPNGNTFMTFGGVPGHVRCTAPPVCIATEKSPGKDGVRGAMSLCLSCMCVCIAQMEGHADFRELTPRERIV